MKTFRIKDASAYLGMSIGTLRIMANNGTLFSFRTPGGHRRFRQADLDKYIKRNFGSAFTAELIQ